MPAISTPHSHTAILFFSHRPEREWRNKWLVRHDYAKSRQVAEAFYQHTLQAAKGSGLPVLEVNDAQQRGDHFGDRLANAFADAFAQGYEQVIAVGNDCPRLHEVDWQAVIQRLAEGTPVLGPTPSREGAYLIGLNRAQFDRQTFAALPWQSRDLFAALAQHLTERAGTVPERLAERDDVNGHRELMALVREPKAISQELIARLRAVLDPIYPIICPEASSSDAHLRRHRLRGPPSMQRCRINR